MPRLNDLHDYPCRDCFFLDYYDCAYLCINEKLPKEFWEKYLFRGVYLNIQLKELDICPYFAPRETCVPSEEVKECQFWCFADYHGNSEECPLWKLRSENN